LFRTRAEVGYYVLAYKVAQVMQVAVAAFSMGWAPLRYRISERPDAAQVYQRLTNHYVLAASVLTVAVAVYAREIVSLIAPPSYAPAAAIVPLITFAYALYGLYVLMVTGMGITKRTVPMAWIVSVAAVVNIGLNIALIPAWGIRAAAVTTVLADAIMVGGGWLYSQRVYPIPYDWKRIARVVIVGAVVVLISTELAPGRGLAGLTYAMVACVAFVLVVVKTGGVDPRDLATARTWGTRVKHRLLRRVEREELVG
jgi:O-antigen/teichoic acid export membrane protein